MGDACYSFVFDDCDSALKAYHERFPEAIELSRAVAIGELEVSGEYDESKHDLLFASFGSDGLDSTDLVMFPTYLVRLNSDQLEAHEREQLFDILSADLPFKVLVQSDDILEPSTVGDGHLAFALHSRGLGSQAVGLTGVFVLQSPASSLMDVRSPLLDGLDYLGPTLVSVFSGASPAAAESSLVPRGRRGSGVARLPCLRVRPGDGGGLGASVLARGERAGRRRLARARPVVRGRRLPGGPRRDRLHLRRLRGWRSPICRALRQRSLRPSGPMRWSASTR